MPYGIENRSYYAAAEQGRQDRQAAQMNALRQQAMQQEIQQANALSGLMKDPNTTPEQFARAGRSDIANSLHNLQPDKAAQAKEFATQMTNAARYGLQAPNPKQFIERNFPFLVETYGPDWANATDEQVRAELQGAAARFGVQAGIAPTEPKDEVYTLTPGQRRFRNGKLEAEVPDRPQPFFRPMSKDEIKAAGLPPGTSAQINTQTGQINVLPGTSGGNITEGERGAANYYGRMKETEKLLKPDFVPSVSEYMAARKVMTGGGMMSSAANKFLSPETQAYYQAASDWVRAKLRKESGAAIGADEMEQEIKTYFPMPGDSPQVVAQKARARIQAQQGMRRMGGRASAEYDEQSPEAPSVTPQPSAPVQVKSDAEYARLPSGTKYVAPDGSVRTKR